MKVAKKVISTLTKHVPELYSTEVYRAMGILCGDLRGSSRLFVPQKITKVIILMCVIDLYNRIFFLSLFLIDF